MNLLGMASRGRAQRPHGMVIVYGERTESSCFQAFMTVGAVSKYGALATRSGTRFELVSFNLVLNQGDPR